MPFSARGGGGPGGFPVLNTTSIQLHMAPPAGGDGAPANDNATANGNNGGAGGSDGDAVTVPIPGGVITGHFTPGQAPSQEEFARMIQLMMGRAVPGGQPPPNAQQPAQQQQQQQQQQQPRQQPMPAQASLLSSQESAYSLASTCTNWLSKAALALIHSLNMHERLQAGSRGSDRQGSAGPRPSVRTSEGPSSHPVVIGSPDAEPPLAAASAAAPPAAAAAEPAGGGADPAQVWLQTIVRLTCAVCPTRTLLL